MMPPRTMRSVLALAVLACACVPVGFYASARWRVAATPDGEALTVQPNSLAVGKVWADPNFPWQVRITNESARSVEVLKIVPSCECTSVGHFPEVLAPGESGLLDLRLNLVNSKPGAFSVSLTCYFHVNGGDFGKSWELTGKIVRFRYEASKDALRLTGNCFSSAPAMEQQVIVQFHDQVESIDAACVPPIGDVRLVQRPDWKLNGKFEILVTPKETLEVGFHRAVLSIYPLFAGQHDPTSHANRPVVAIPVLVILRPNVRPIPDGLRLGRLRVGTIRSETVLLDAFDRSEFRVTSVAVVPTLMHESVSVERAASERGPGPQVFSVSVRAAATGAQAGNVEFTIQEWGRDETYVSRLPFQYVGVD